MGVKKLKIKNDVLNKDLELEFKKVVDNNEAVIIFGRNGSGKTTLSNAIYNWKDMNGEGNNCFIYNETSSLINDSFKQNVFVFGKDFDINFKKSDDFSTVISNDNEVMDSTDEMINIYDNISFIAKNIARFGGSLKKPEATLARRLKADFYIDSATFDSNRKEQFTKKGKIGFLNDIIDLVMKFRDDYNKYIKKEEWVTLDWDELSEEFRNLNQSRQETLILLFSVLKKQGNNSELHIINSLIEEYEQSFNGVYNNIDKDTTVEQLTSLNHAMEIIFLNKDRLIFPIEQTNNKSSLFTIHSRGKVVKNLSLLSQAEQNIVKIAFFLTNVEDRIKEKAINNQDKEEFLIVLDDPISSTDNDNKIGIYSYLQTMLTRLSLINDNFKIKVIALTHDEDFYYSFYAILKGKEANKYFKQTFELSDWKLIKRTDTHHFYSQMLTELYLYIENPDSKKDMYIGNLMRRILESYSSFNYGVGIVDLFNLDSVLEKIKDKNKRDEYKSICYHLYLNDSSHGQNSVKMYKYQSISEIEKRELGKKIIKFLYDLDSVHVISHIKTIDSSSKDKKNIEKERERIASTIESWD